MKINARPGNKPRLLSTSDISCYLLSLCAIAYLFPKYLGHDYYVKLLDRLVQSLQGKMPFPFMDWRFNEFPNESAHALYATSIEIMALPVIDPVQVSMDIRPSRASVVAQQLSTRLMTEKSWVRILPDAGVFSPFFLFKK